MQGQHILSMQVKCFGMHGILFRMSTIGARYESKFISQVGQYLKPKFGMRRYESNYESKLFELRIKMLSHAGLYYESNYESKLLSHTGRVELRIQVVRITNQNC